MQNPVVETTPAWMQNPAVDDAPTPAASANYEDDFRTELAQLEAAARARGEPGIRSDAQVALLDRHRMRAGLPPLMPQQNLQDFRVAEANAANRDSTMRDFSTGALQSMAGFGTNIVGLVAPETAAGMRQNIDAQYGTPQGVAGEYVGSGVGTLATGLAALTTGPVGMAGIYGASGAGGARTDIAERRADGQAISGGMEAAATLGSGAVEGLSGFVGGKLFSAIAKPLQAAVPQLKQIIASQGAEAGQAALVGLMRNAVKTAGLSAAEGGEEALTQLAGNLVRQLTYAPEQELSDGVAQAGAMGAALAPVFGGAVGYARSRRQPESRLTDGVSPPSPPPPPVAALPAVTAPAPAVNADPNVDSGSAPVAPARPQPNPAVAQQAEEYTRVAGVKPTPYKPGKVDEPKATTIASLYEQATHRPNDPEVKAAYDAFKSEAKAQWDFLRSKGVQFEPWTQEGQPYKTSADMMADVAKGHLYYFKGGDIPKDHPLAEVVEGDTTYNDVFRAIHDYFGHAKDGNQFGANGEENAWRAHSAMFSPLARRAMTTETRGQNSWVNYGPLGAQNRADPKNTQYAQQKATLLPEWVADPDATPVSEGADRLTGSDQTRLGRTERATAEDMITYVRTMEGDTAELLRAELEAEKSDFVRVRIPKDRVDPNILADEAGKPLAGQVDMDKLEDAELFPAETAPPIVSVRGDGGKVKVIDGTHRVLRALRDPNITEVSAWVPETWAREQGLVSGDPEPAAPRKTRDEELDELMENRARASNQPTSVQDALRKAEEVGNQADRRAETLSFEESKTDVEWDALNTEYMRLSNLAGASIQRHATKHLAEETSILPDLIAAVLREHYGVNATTFTNSARREMERAFAGGQKEVETLARVASDLLRDDLHARGFDPEALLSPHTSGLGGAEIEQIKQKYAKAAETIHAYMRRIVTGEVDLPLTDANSAGRTPSGDTPILTQPARPKSDSELEDNYNAIILRDKGPIEGIERPEVTVEDADIPFDPEVDPIDIPFMGERRTGTKMGAVRPTRSYWQRIRDVVGTGFGVEYNRPEDWVQGKTEARGRENLTKMDTETWGKVFQRKMKEAGLDPRIPMDNRRVSMVLRGDLPVASLPGPMQDWVMKARAAQDAESAHAADVFEAAGLTEKARVYRDNIGKYLKDVPLDYVTPGGRIRDAGRRLAGMRITRSFNKFRRDAWVVTSGKSVVGKFATEAEARQATQGVKDARVHAPIDELYKSGNYVQDPKYLIAKGIVETRHNAEMVKLFSMASQQWGVDAPTGLNAQEMDNWAEDNNLVRLPKQDELHTLSNRFVPKEIGEDLMEMVRIPNIAEKLYRGYINAWKTTKTVLNPATHMRNMMGNPIFAEMAGVSTFNPSNLRWYKAGLKSLHQRDPAWREMVEQGVIGSEYYGAELNKLEPFVQRNNRRPLIDAAFSGVDMIKAGVNRAGDFYSAQDQFFKAAAYTKYRASGMSPKEAAAEVNKWYPNYARVGRVTKWLRNTPWVGSPFVAFFDQALRIGGRAVKERPLRVAKIAALPAVLSEIGKWAVGLDDEEKEILDTNRSYWEPYIPWRDDRGRAQTFDMRYIVPLANDIIPQSRNGSTIVPWMFSGPLPNVVIEQLSGRERFTGRPIITDKQTAGERLRARASSIAKAAAPVPPLLAWGSGRISDSLGKGAEESLAHAIMGTIFGVNIKTPYVAEEQVVKIARQMFGEGDKLEARALIDVWNGVYKPKTKEFVEWKDVVYGLRRNIKRNKTEAIKAAAEALMQERPNDAETIIDTYNKSKPETVPALTVERAEQQVEVSKRKGKTY